MSALVTTWAVVAALFSLVALARLKAVARGAAAAAPAPGRPWPHVLLLRPVDAPTPIELENLAAPIDYPGELTHVVLSPLPARGETGGARWLHSDPLCNNRKVGHLTWALATLPREKDTVVVCVDADVRVDGALLTGLADELGRGAALASAAPVPEVSDGLPGRAVRGLLVQSHHAFAALDVMSAGAKAVCGKALALSPVAQAALVRLGDCIGEDLELSQLMHEAGLPVAMTSAPAAVPQAGVVRLRPVVERFTRWMQVLRAHRPVLFPTVPFFFAPTPLLVPLTAWVGTPGAALALALLVASRIALANQLDRRAGLRLEWLLAELLLLTCWVEALRAGRTVRWRGRRFELGRGGRIAALPESAGEVAS